MIVDPDNVRPSVALERPSGKKATFYCVRFFPLGDHAWIVEKDISKLQRHEFGSYIPEPFKKLSQLCRFALDPATWISKNEAVIQDTADMEENTEIDQPAETEDREEDDALGKNKGTRGKMETNPPHMKEKKEREKADKSAKAIVEFEDEGEAEVDAEDEAEEDDPGAKSAQKAPVAAEKAAASPPPAKRAKQDRGAKVATTYIINDTVLAKARGYPPWTAMVVDPDNVDLRVTLECPSSKKATFYCTRFFPLGDHAWIAKKDISKLHWHEIESYISERHGKSSKLLNRCCIALAT